MDGFHTVLFAYIRTRPNVTFGTTRDWKCSHPLSPWFLTTFWVSGSSQQFSKSMNETLCGLIICIRWVEITLEVLFSCISVYCHNWQKWAARKIFSRVKRLNWSLKACFEKKPRICKLVCGEFYSVLSATRKSTMASSRPQMALNC